MDPSQKRGLFPFPGSGLRGLLGLRRKFKKNSYIQFSKIKGRGQNSLCLFCYWIPNGEVNKNVLEGGARLWASPAYIDFEVVLRCNDYGVKYAKRQGH